MAYIARTDKTAHRDHIHVLVTERYVYDTEIYKYRCLECGTRLKRKSGVMARRSVRERERPGGS